MNNCGENNILLFAEGLKKSFAGKTVLDIGELTVRGGESVVLSGENGSGKTTLLKILAGLLRPDSARALAFAGCERYPRGAPHSSYLHQSPYLFSASVRANVEYGLRRAGLPGEKRKQKAEDAMRWAGVLHLASARADRLSGGEQRRAALARIRALSPRLCLLDEPLAHLDEEGIKRAEELIPQLRKGGCAVVTATHKPFADATQQWRLQNGKLICEQ